VLRDPSTSSGWQVKPSDLAMSDEVAHVGPAMSVTEVKHMLTSFVQKLTAER